MEQPQTVVSPPRSCLVYEAQVPGAHTPGMVQSQSVVQYICISVPLQGVMPAVDEQVTGWLRWMVPSGQREKPEAVPSVVGTGTAPGHSLPPEPATLPAQAARPRAVSRQARRGAS